jgi:hypothetical protein
MCPHLLPPPGGSECTKPTSSCRKRSGIGRTFHSCSWCKCEGGGCPYVFMHVGGSEGVQSTKKSGRRKMNVPVSSTSFVATPQVLCCAVL